MSYLKSLLRKKKLTLTISFSLRGYRNLSETSRIEISQQVNIIIGPNNAGKSNILRAIALVLAPNNTRHDKLSDIDYTDPEKQTIYCELRSYSAAPFLSSHADHNYFRILEAFFTTLIEKNGYISSFYTITEAGKSISFDREQTSKVLLDAVHQDRMLTSSIREVWRVILNGSGGDISHWTSTLVQRVYDILPSLQRQTLFLPSSRYITTGDEVPLASNAPIMSDSLKCHEIIERLFKMKNPRTGEDKEIIKFQKIEIFLREVTGNPTLKLQIAWDGNEITVELDGKRLPLSNLGSGIEQILIMATFSVSFSDKIILIDEPELHIHPILQRKLMKFISETENKFFVTTHSPSIIDAIPAGIHSVQSQLGWSVVRSIEVPSDRHSAVSDLGYRPSDLVQTNFIFWVEGPSDRIYVRSWLANVDPGLVEGLDFTIMFYAGRLLSHFVVGTDTQNEFIDVLNINRRCAILIDSDRSSQDKRINSTKSRILKEAKAAGAITIVTGGREIENYVARDVYNTILAEYGWPSMNYGRFLDLMTIRRQNSTRKNPTKKIDKVDFAHRVIAREPLPKDRDLLRKLKLIASKIREASLRDLRQ